jgi:hypothetical protein
MGEAVEGKDDQRRPTFPAKKSLPLSLDKETLVALKAGLASLDSPSSPVFEGRTDRGA